MPYHRLHDELFDWDAANVEHVRRHGVEPHEAEEALGDPQRLHADAHRQAGEPRRMFIGATTRGRTLTVVVTRRSARIRVVTARDASERERRRYRRRRP